MFRVIEPISLITIAQLLWIPTLLTAASTVTVTPTAVSSSSSTLSEALVPTTGDTLLTSSSPSSALSSSSSSRSSITSSRPTSATTTPATTLAAATALTTTSATAAVKTSDIAAGTGAPMANTTVMTARTATALTEVQTVVTTTLSSTTQAPFIDHGVCTTRYIGYGNRTSSVASAVSIAVITELHRSGVNGCGPVSMYGLQIAAAHILAVRRLNGEGMTTGPFIPGVRFNLQVLDDCSNAFLAARHVGELLTEHQDFSCTPTQPSLAGVIGTATSTTTATIARILAGTHIPQFGLSATASTLSNKDNYPNFYRTVPSDMTQSKVLVQLVKSLLWTYVAGIHSSDNYGKEGFTEFSRLAELEGICIYKNMSFLHSDVTAEISVENYIRSLLIDLVDKTKYGVLGVVFFGHDSEASLIFKVIEEKRSKWGQDVNRVLNVHWVFSEGVGTSEAVLSKAYQLSNRLFSISPPVVPLLDVKEFFDDLLNNPSGLGPYWSGLVTELCSTTTSSCDPSQIMQQEYISSALDSIYSLAVLVQKAHLKLCGGVNSPGVCEKLNHALKTGLLSVSKPEGFDYTAVFSPETGNDQRLPVAFRMGRILAKDPYGGFVPVSTPLYYINQADNQQWKRIGEYINGSLKFDSQAMLTGQRVSACGKVCSECLHNHIKFQYVPGDILLVGLFSVSSEPSGSGSDKFVCSGYRGQDMSVAALKAFVHSVDQLNLAAGASVRFGSLVLDDCYSGLVASSLIADLFNKKTILTDSSGQEVVLDKVVAAVGSQSSSVTLSALNLFTSLEVPTISYSATSPDLDDRISFPYFLRPVPSDTLQAQALLQIVQKLGISYVGLAYQDNNYGLRGMQRFTQLARDAGICVAQPVEFSSQYSGDVIYQKLFSLSSSGVKVVVTFITELTAVSILDTMKSYGGLNLVFVASEGWGITSLTIQGGRGLKGLGSLVLAVSSSRRAKEVDISRVFSSLTTKDVMALDDPWLGDFWESRLQCNLPSSFKNNYPIACSDVANLSKAQVQELSTDQRVVHTINTVASIVKALTQTCRDSQNPTECMHSMSAKNKTDKIKGILLVDQNDQSFRPYLDDGNGNVGFTLYNLQRIAESYKYVEVGNYDPRSGLQITQTIEFHIQSTCNNVSACVSVCGLGPVTTLKPPVSTGVPLVEDRGGLIAAVVVLGVLCALCVAVVMVIVCCACRTGRIPFLGKVMKNQWGISCRRSVNDTSGSQQGQEFHHISIPLPPIPGEDNQHTSGYDVPSDLSDSRVSICWSSVSTLYPKNTRDSGHAKNRSTNTSISHSHGSGSTHRTSLSVLQQSQQQQQHQYHAHLEHFQRAVPPPSPRQIIEQYMERPRARSMSNDDRSELALQKGNRQSMDNCSGNNTRTSTPTGATFQCSGRPRSQSHDAAFRNRLGALSDEDHQILMRYFNAARAKKAPCQPQTNNEQKMPAISSEFVPSMQAENMQPPSVTRQTSHPVKFQWSSSDGEDQQSAGIMLENPLSDAPSFCSSRSSLWPSYESEYPLAKNSSLMYLHPVPSQHLLLQTPTESSSCSLPDTDSTSKQKLLSTKSNNMSESSANKVLNSAKLAAPSTTVHLHDSSVDDSENFRLGSSSSDHRQAESLAAQLSCSDNGSAVSDPAASPVSVSSSSTGRTTSESSGAVFVSPDQEHPGMTQQVLRPTNSVHLAKKQPPGHKQTISNKPSYHRPMPPRSLPLSSNMNSGKTSPRLRQGQLRSSPVMCSTGTHDQYFVPLPEAMCQPPIKQGGSSKSSTPSGCSDRMDLSPQTNPNTARHYRQGSAAEMSSPQSNNVSPVTGQGRSIPQLPVFSGMVMHDGRGAVYLLPQVIPLHQPSLYQASSPSLQSAVWQQMISLQSPPLQQASLQGAYNPLLQNRPGSMVHFSQMTPGYVDGAAMSVQPAVSDNSPAMYSYALVDVGLQETSPSEQLIAVPEQQRKSTAVAGLGGSISLQTEQHQSSMPKSAYCVSTKNQPRMGVDALSAPRKSISAQDALQGQGSSGSLNNLGNAQPTEGRHVSASYDDSWQSNLSQAPSFSCGGSYTSDAVQNGSTNSSAAASDGIYAPVRSESSNPVGSAVSAATQDSGIDGPPSLEGRLDGARTSSDVANASAGMRHEDSIPYIQGYQLITKPQPCGPFRSANACSSGSETSNHTTTDSGNGDDLCNDMNHDLTIKPVNVMS